jgi:hypothetical protein
MLELRFLSEYDLPMCHSERAEAREESLLAVILIVNPFGKHLFWEFHMPKGRFSISPYHLFHPRLSVCICG